LKDELNWWPVIIIGVFGIIIFGIPFHRGKRDHFDGVLRSTPRAL
jgi:hypothetical protein